MMRYTFTNGLIQLLWLTVSQRDKMPALIFVFSLLWWMVLVCL